MEYSKLKVYKEDEIVPRGMTDGFLHFKFRKPFGYNCTDTDLETALLVQTLRVVDETMVRLKIYRTGGQK